MGRPRGTRNADYENRRRELAFRIFKCILEDSSTSFNAMAEQIGVSRPTLRHYFGGRDSAIRAALEEAAKIGRPHIESLRIPSADNPVSSLQHALSRIVFGWRNFGVINIHHVGLKIGLEDDKTGTTYLSQILEPTLQAIEGLLQTLQDRGSLEPHCTRQGALSLLSPIILGLLHQDGLGGKELRPMVIEELIDSLVQGYCRQHAAPGAQPNVSDVRTGSGSREA